MARLGPARQCFGFALTIVLCACKPAAPAGPAAGASALDTDPWAPIESFDPQAIHAHVKFLADDAQQGRAPGTEADQRVQDYIIQQMRDAGLEAGFADGFRQPFQITDGVRAKSGQSTKLEHGSKAIVHDLLPFSGDSSASGPIEARLVFAGYGIARGGPNTGDYAGIRRKVKGSIVVALHGAPDDPHLDPSLARPQTKLIAARDHGAAGFVLWDPDIERPVSNHGIVHDLGLPAAQVGAAGTPALVEAFGARAIKSSAEIVAKLKPGKQSRAKLTLHTPVEPVTLETANVAGRLPGTKSERIVVIGAHMDHLGLGTSSSLAPGEQAVHNGADDNASGVGVVLALARSFAGVDQGARSYDVMFVAFGAEEMGLLGSKHFVRSLDEGVRSRIVAMLNFDMVGRMGEDGLVVSGTGSSSVWAKLVEDARADVTIRSNEDGYGPSDHSSFYEAGVPVLHFFTGPHEDYHRPSDDTDKLNFDGAAAVAGVAARVVRALMASASPPDYIKVARPAQRRGGFRVSLGTIPDYAAKVDGLRLSGVRAGGAAAKAGLQKGDVIKKLAGREIHNIDDYVAAFTVLKPGIEIDVEIERDGKAQTVKMTPSAPKPR